MFDEAPKMLDLHKQPGRALRGFRPKKAGIE